MAQGEYTIFTAGMTRNLPTNHCGKSPLKFATTAHPPHSTPPSVLKYEK